MKTQANTICSSNLWAFFLLCMFWTISDCFLVFWGVMSSSIGMASFGPASVAHGHLHPPPWSKCSLQQVQHWHWWSAVYAPQGVFVEKKTASCSFREVFVFPKIVPQVYKVYKVYNVKE